MADLFSSLDGCYSFISWGVPMLFPLLFLTSTMWAGSVSLAELVQMALPAQPKKSLYPGPLILKSVLTLILLVNLMGLVPFVSSPSSSLWFGGTLALVCWGGILLSGFFFSPKQAVAHLAPSGAPWALLPFLILIETISILIRPLTLTVRLVANISAGHIVMGLVANLLSSLSGAGAALVAMLSVGYFLFEIFVCVIQAYIFTLLLGLYMEEHP
uniref:ATP synthase subunit a n=1 Tax=Myosotella myosotis TaxID=252580 RepID=B3DFF4_9EUPU|nr:ATP synthase F0 subunit 6 [Myosotella myosotis]ACE62841.1 ATP synthase F0 subunit 6 [Myosotella myosotis]